MKSLHFNVGDTPSYGLLWTNIYLGCGCWVRIFSYDDSLKLAHASSVAGIGNGPWPQQFKQEEPLLWVHPPRNKDKVYGTLHLSYRSPYWDEGELDIISYQNYSIYVEDSQMTIEADHSEGTRFFFEIVQEEI